MKKKLVLIVVLIVIVTGCVKKEITELEVPIIKAECVPLEKVTCYRDGEDNEECFGEDICLYVEYKKQKLTVEEVLKQKLITLNDIKKSYHNFYGNLKY